MYIYACNDNYDDDDDDEKNKNKAQEADLHIWFDDELKLNWMYKQQKKIVKSTTWLTTDFSFRQELHFVLYVHHTCHMNMYVGRLLRISTQIYTPVRTQQRKNNFGIRERVFFWLDRCMMDRFLLYYCSCIYTVQMYNKYNVWNGICAISTNEMIFLPLVSSSVVVVVVVVVLIFREHYKNNYFQFIYTDTFILMADTFLLFL